MTTLAFAVRGARPRTIGEVLRYMVFFSRRGLRKFIDREPEPTPVVPRFRLKPRPPTDSVTFHGQPTVGRISSRYGPRWDHMHKGVDIAAPIGTPVWATARGTVIVASRRGTAGLAVIIDHGEGRRTAYFHLSRIDVRVGDQVDAGDQLGAVGETGNARGPHLHYEMHVDGVKVDPTLGWPS